MSYKNVQDLRKKELQAFGISEQEAEEIMAAEEEYGVSYRDTLELAMEDPAAYHELIDDDKVSGFDYEG